MLDPRMRHLVFVVSLNSVADVEICVKVTVDEAVNNTITVTNRHSRRTNELALTTTSTYYNWSNAILSTWLFSDHRAKAYIFYSYNYSAHIQQCYNQTTTSVTTVGYKITMDRLKHDKCR